MNKRTEITYWHDGGPFKSKMIIRTLDYKDGKYTFQFETDDVTDYHRFMWLLEFSVQNNIITKEIMYE